MLQLSNNIEYSDLIGKPFKDGGRGPDAFDCWGLVMEVFRRAGMVLPNYEICCYDPERIHSQIEAERAAWVRCAEPLPIPCLVAIRFNQPVKVNHCGVFLGEGKFIHAREKTGVCIDRIESPAFARKIEGFYLPERKS